MKTFMAALVASLLASPLLAQGWIEPMPGTDPAFAVRSLELPPPKEEGTIIQGEDDPAAAAAELVKLLREQAKAI